LTREAKEVKGTSALLRGELNPHAAFVEEEEYHFAYAQSPDECSGLVTPEPAPLATGAEKEPVSSAVAGLQPDRQYTFCLVAFHTPLGEAPEESPPGSPITFTTSPMPPSVPTVTTPVPTPFEVRLEGAVNPDNEPTTCVFEYGETTAYGSSVPCEQGTLEGYEEQGQGVSANVSHLTPGTTYYFRLRGTNQTGESSEGEGTGEFTTQAAAAPSVEPGTEHASSVTSNAATLEAQLDANYQTTKYAFEYSTSATGETLEGEVATVRDTSRLAPIAGAQGASVLTGSVLTPGTTYYYRAVAENATGSATPGPVRAFTTVPTPVTEAPSVFTATTATFAGTLAPLNENVATKYYFEYNQGAQCSGGSTTTPEGEAGTGAGTRASATFNATGLQPAAEYTVCLVAANEFAAGESARQQGPAVHFNTPVAPPRIDGESAPEVWPYEAKLEAQVNPDGQTTTYAFEYSTQETSGVLEGTITKVAGFQALPVGAADQSASVVTEPLAPATTYYYRVVATNDAGTTPGIVEHFETSAEQAPEIQAEGVSNITPTGATLEAQIEAHEQETGYSFEYSPEESVIEEGKGTAVQGGELTGDIATGFQNHATAQVAGLQPGTLYYYRVNAANGAGSAPEFSSTIQRFRTSSVPLVSTGSAQGVTASTVTLSGTVDPDGLPTTYYFQYGGTTAYGQQSPVGEAGQGTSSAPHAIVVNGLAPDRTYHYRIVASNENGGAPQAAYGQDQTFTTPSTPPILIGTSVSNITLSSATITATLESQGLPTRYELQLGSTPGQLQEQTSGDTTGVLPLELGVGSLSPGTTYYYRLVATSLSGSSEPEGSFTTVPGPAVSPAATPALIPYQSIAELNAKEAKEDKKLPGPVVTRTLTNAEKLKKALKACKKKKGAKRAKCEASARKKYPTAKARRKAK
jgi:phosphodiesterase/alkaline phosphatase D-like protein